MTVLSLEQLAILKLLLDADGIGPARLKKLYSKFGSIENVFNANYSEIKNVEGFSDSLAKSVISSKNKYNDYKEKTLRELDKLHKLNARIISLWDKEYPTLLKNIYDPPILLYIKGNFSEADDFSIAIVGSRSPSLYGKIHAEKISYDLASEGLSIVSGLARGVDATAHIGAIKANGRTIAVIGSGLDVIYPPENKKLFSEIINNGIVISEYKLGTKPDAENFPRRNRIISGLSLAVIVVESGAPGGALQTAAFALDQNREIYALPGNIDQPKSEGCNLLIKKGEAKLLTSYKEVIEDLQIKLKPALGINIPKPDISLNMFEEKILKSLSNNPKHIDIIAAESSMSTSDCLVNLLSLEFKEVVKQLPGKMFIKF